MNRAMSALAAAGLLSVTVAANAWADGDAEKGKRVFNKCKSCHELTAEKNKIETAEVRRLELGVQELVGILGRKSGSVAGFKYSSAMQNANIVWDEKTIDTYITDPKKFVPGNKMVLAPIKDEGQRADLIAYLKQQQKK